LRSFINWLSAFALSIGGPGLFTIAALDSSFVSLPQINDLLVVLMVTGNKAWMPYYALMATLGSVVGCSILYVLAKKGGEALLRRRVSSARVDRALALYRRHGVLALMVPALLPPPAPFKLFVLLAGVSGVRPLPFALSIAVGRGMRYFGIGLLSVWYGQQAVTFLQTHGTEVAIVVAVLMAATLGGWLALRHYRRREPALTSAG
jgi:membrane protein YqaA with SNARE-associated domain